MNRNTTLLVTSLAVFIGIQAGHAQDGPPTFSPLEIFGCNYVGSSDMGDLNTVIATWNEWMDTKGMNNYTALTLTPHFTAADFPYDVLWLGVWADGAALGGTTQWLSEGGEVQDDFADVIDCPLHHGMAVTNIREPADPPSDIAPVEFSNCTVHDGRTGPEAGGAIIEFAEFMAENGSSAGHWILLPGPGEEADADYSFKWVTGYSSWDSVGADFELYMNGGGRQRFAALTGRVVSCDAPRMYNSQLFRAAAEDS